MKNTHATGNVGEMRVAYEATKRGYIVSIPVGHDARYDMIVERHGKLERVQVKTVNSDGECIGVRLKSVGKLDGKTIAKKYTSDEIDWVVVFDITTDQCLYVPAAIFGTGMNSINIRLKPSKSGMKKRCNFAEAFRDW